MCHDSRTEDGIGMKSGSKTQREKYDDVRKFCNDIMVANYTVILIFPCFT